MKYTLNTTYVRSEIARFNQATLREWQACIAVLLDDPTPRFGTFTTKDVPIREYPSRTWIYEIETEVSISGEVRHVFTSETLPWFLIVYVVDESKSEVVVVSLRENHRA